MLARVLASVGALVTVSGQSAPARAMQAPGLPLRLTVTAAFGCPDEATLLSQVKAYAPRVRAALPTASPPPSFRSKCILAALCWRAS